LFESDNLALDLRYVAESVYAGVGEGVSPPDVPLDILDLSAKGHKGPAVQSFVMLEEGQAVTFILRTPPTELTRSDPDADANISNLSTVEARESTAALAAEREPGMVRALPKGRSLDDPYITKELVDTLLRTTNRYWYEWISQSTYKGAWKESVHRSALALKLLIFEPTGAVVASPTFSLPEYIGGVRNWDYRYSWIRDSSFTLYALIRLGFTEEANRYLEFIFERLRNKNPDGSLQIMYSIHGMVSLIFALPLLIYSIRLEGPGGN